MALRSRVILLPRGSSSAIQHWEEVRGDNVERGREITRWDEIRNTLAERARDVEQKDCEVVICMLDDQLVKQRDHDLLKLVLRDARECCWGAPLLLVVSRDIRPDRIYKDRVAVEEWLHTAMAGGALDLLQLSYDPDGLTLLENPDLGRCRADARLRLQYLRELPREGLWGCSLSDQRTDFKRLLATLACLPGGNIHSRHLMVAVDRGNAKDQSEFVQQRLVEFGTRVGLVATLGNSPSQGLESICEEAKLPAPLSFRAEMEIWYFLLRLNARHRPQVVEMREGHRVVALNPAPKFQSIRGSKPLSVLITSSFVPGLDHPEQVAEAARDIGAMLERCPIAARYEVDQRFTPERLTRMLGEERSLLGWIHLGHGLGEAGIEDAERQPVEPARCLKCFGGWQGSLPLVLFLSCDSIPVADCFARAGAGVAIGFAGKVLSRRSRILAVNVIEAAFRGGGHRDLILQAFDAGRERLDAVGNPSQPFAIYTEP
jgi:hypothetical protein